MLARRSWTPAASMSLAMRHMAYSPLVSLSDQPFLTQQRSSRRNFIHLNEIRSVYNKQIWLNSSSKYASGFAPCDTVPIDSSREVCCEIAHLFPPSVEAGAHSLVTGL